MRGSVYLKTLTDLRGTIIAGSLGVAFIGAVNVLLFPTIQNMEGLVRFLEGLPPVFKAMIGDVSAMARLEGFLHVKLFDPLPLLLVIFGIAHAAQLLAGELEHKHVDLLLARPVRRWRVVLAKYLAVASGLVVLAVVMAATVVACARVIEAEVAARYLILATLNALPLTLLFTALALLGSSLAAHPRRPAFAAAAVVVLSYVLETLRLVSPALAGWRPVSLFAYHKAGFPLIGTPDPGAVAVLLGFTALLVAGACLIWERRDLAS
jgi:ABC-2 type transport system permease protein